MKFKAEHSSIRITSTSPVYAIMSCPGVKRAKRATALSCFDSKLPMENLPGDIASIVALDETR
jgi:hypothetical protein